MKCRFYVVILLLCIGSSAFAQKEILYACQPSYEYNGWLSKRKINLQSSYYRGYGPSKEVAEKQALFLCNQVYQHCFTEEKKCKVITNSIDWCWVEGHEFSGYHHDQNAAKWIAKKLCQQHESEHQSDRQFDYDEISCSAIKCTKLPLPVLDQRRTQSFDQIN